MNKQQANMEKAQAAAKAGQAAVELAVFGAILIFLLGSIIRSAAGNGLTQNQNFNAMRTALLSSWVDSEAGNPSHNNASLLIVEDRLSPDFNKYGDLDRNQYISSSGGSFTYEMLYPIDENEVNGYLPIMDVWVNGQHFPFTTAAFNTDSFSSASKTVSSTSPNVSTSCSGSPTETFPLSQGQCLQNQCLRNQREWVQNPNNGVNYKLFYTMVANAAGKGSYYAIVPPTCNNPFALSCKNWALSITMALPDSQGGTYTNTTGDMEFDLLRNGDYAAVDNQFPLVSSICSTSLMMLRCNIAWQWGADVAAVVGSTTDGADPMIELDPDDDEYPQYDIDGRLKQVTIYGYTADQSSPPAITSVSYEDFQGGDIDTTWDSNSCSLKPGLQNDSEIYTFTGNGTYLQIKEGQLYNPQTGKVVSSVNQRNNVDLIQRPIQLSNSTGRFCPQSVSGTVSTQNLSLAGYPRRPLGPAGDVGGTNVPNPVEVCSNNCFTSATIAQTCYDTTDNVIYVRSRIQDLRGNNWMTNASGQLQVQ